MFGLGPDRGSRRRAERGRRPARKARIAATGLSALVAGGGVAAMVAGADADPNDAGGGLGAVAGGLSELEGASAPPSIASAVVPVRLPAEVGPGVS